MPMFRKRPVTVEAVQLRWTNWSDPFLNDIVSEKNPGRMVETASDTCGENAPYIELTIPTLEGDRIARHGDWLVRGVQGEVYPVKPKIFAALYEAIEAGDAP
jgi:hypothetical protein